jgi:LuxR family maltose regulon positive regulatory protein
MLGTEPNRLMKDLAPKRRAHEVARDRLVDLMLAGVGKKAQIVCAPAGYGKTALLVQFVEALGLPACWYSCTPEDQNPQSFLRYCLTAIRVQFAEFASSHLTLLTGSGSADWRTDLGLFVSALHTDIKGRLVLVLDDLHWIDGKEETEEALSLLIDRAPANVHFVLASRVWPSLPCLPKLEVDDELATVESADLRCTAEEAVQILSRLCRQPVAPEVGEVIRRATGGWAAAIVLASKGLSTSDQPDLAKIRENGVLCNYIAQEVFNRLPDSLQQFALKTSILRQVTAPICDRLLGLSSSQSLINQVKDRGLFLEKRAEGGAAFAYDDLFREYLEHRFRAENPAEYQSLCATAARLLSELGDFDAAIRLFLQAGEPGNATQLLKQAARPAFDQGRWQQLASWLAHLPPDTVAKDPELLLLKGQVLQRLGDPTGALEQLDKILAGSPGSGQEMRGKALVAKSTAYRRLGHLDLAVQAATAGLSLLEGANAPKDDLAEGYKQLGCAHSVQGEYVLAQRELHTALSLTNRENLRLFSLISNDLGVVYIELGDLDQAGMYLEQARAGLLKLGSEGQLAEALINLALVYYQKGEFDLALVEANAALRAAEAGDYPRLVATALMNRAIVERAFGSYDDSVASASRALEMARQLLDQRLIAESTKVLGDAYRKRGETSKAEVLLRQAILESEDSGQRYIAAIYHVSLGKVCCQLGDLGQAMEHLKVGEQQLADLKNARRLAEAKLYLAAAYYRTDKLKDAVEELNGVAGLVSEVGYDGFLLADGDEVLDVLRFGAARRLGGGVFVRLVWRLTRSGLPGSKAEGEAAELGEATPFPTVKACSFGTPRVILDTHEVTDAEWRSGKSKELFFLLLYHKRTLSNEELVEALWPEDSVEVSTSTLKTSIYRLRQALFYDCIVAKEPGYCINPNVPIEFDVDAFLLSLKLAAVPGKGRDERERLLSLAIGLYGGAFLNGVNSPWCEGPRTDLELKYHTALMGLAQCRATRGDFLQVAALLERVVVADPYNDEAQYQLIEGYLLADQPLVALQQLRSYARLSQDELGADLPPRFVDIYNKILKVIPRSG